MKKLLFLAIMAVTLFASCQKKDFAEPTIEVSYDFTATFAETRTELNGTAVVWCEEDLLTIFTKTSHNRKYQVKELSEDNRTATFGYVSFTGNDNTKITTNYALYPYDADATLTGGVITTTLQSTQTYNGANGNLGYALMAAQSASNNFSFRNAGSLLRFKVSKLVPDAFTLKTIKVASANNNIAGEVTINLNSDAKAVVTSNGVKEITLTDINYEVTTDVAEFYVAIPAMSFADKDLTVTFVFEEGEKVFELPAFDLEQGKIKSITYKINDAEDFTGSTPNDGPANNEIWYTARSNSEPRSEVYDATIKSWTWDEESGKGVITFDGVVTKITGDAFIDHGGLKSVTLPESIISIAEGAFYHQNIEAFYGKFSTDDNKALVVDNVMIAYAAGNNATTYTIPDGTTKIGNRAFQALNSSLTEVIIPDSVTSIGEYAFECCASLKDIYCKPTTPPAAVMTWINWDAFYGNAPGRKIYVPAASVDAYKSAKYWSDYASDIVGYDF